MSEAEQPAVPPVPPEPQAEQKPEPPPAAQGEPKREARPNQPQMAPRPPRPLRDNRSERGERREPLPPRPPSLEQEQQYGGGRVSVKEFDDQVERELEEAMSGMSTQDIYGEPEKQQRRKPAGDAKPGPLKGKV